MKDIIRQLEGRRRVLQAELDRVEEAIKALSGTSEKVVKAKRMRASSAFALIAEGAYSPSKLRERLGNSDNACRTFFSYHLHRGNLKRLSYGTYALTAQGKKLLEADVSKP